jgi:hypothetical protein
MSRIACIYFEGNDCKVALFEKGTSKIKLLKAQSIDTSLAFSEQKSVTEFKGAKKLKESYQYNFVSEESAAFNRNFLQKLNEFFLGEDLTKIKFIPILCEPAIYFQKVNDEKDLASLNINPSGKIETTIDFVKLYDNSRLAVYPSGQSSYLQAIDSLAKMNNRKFFKIPAVKSAEISLASYISRRRKFNDKDTTLILYVGKEYSKFIFLQGRKLLHVGSTLSVGKNSFDAHNVIVSKILLEMEHGSINNFDNIIICGEDDSGDLQQIINEAYPKAKVSLQNLESIAILDPEALSNESAFIVPVSVAEEYYAEIDKQLEGINLLPNYIKEEQKFFHLEWKGLLVFLLIIASGVFFFSKITSNIQQTKQKDNEIQQLLITQEQNREAAQKLKSYDNKIKNVDRTKAILSQLSVGTEILSAQLKKLSDFTNQNRDIWINQLTMDKNRNLKLGGYTLSRRVVKKLSDSYNGSILQNIVYDPLRETRIFKFAVDAGNLTGGIKNEEKK